MNINITITGDTNSPDVQSLLSHLAQTIPGTITIQDQAPSAPVAPVKPITSGKGSAVAGKPKDKQVSEVTPVQNESPVVVEETKPEETKVDPPKHSAEQVRAAAVKKSGSGKREEVKALIESFGTPNLAGLKPEQFDSFMEQLDAI